MGALISALLETFWSKRLELIVVGLDNAGKTTLLNVLAHGRSVETVPTLGMNVKQMRHGGVKMKVWDVGGQSRFRDEWNRYAQGCNCILYVVDTADRPRLEEARRELHRLLEHVELHGLPLLIVANKIDLPGHLEKDEMVKGLNLDYITENVVGIMEISALESTNIDKVIEWMVEHAPED